MYVLVITVFLKGKAASTARPEVFLAREPDEERWKSWAGLMMP